MSILLHKDTRVAVQGITGKEGSFHTKQMLEYGTLVKAGVVPGKGGEKFEGVPIYDTMRDAVNAQKVTASVIFVPSFLASDAIMEAVDAGLDLVVCITEGIPALDMVTAYSYLKNTKTRLIGPNCPGIISPGKSKMGIMPGAIHKEGKVGVISRSGTLTYEVVQQLTDRDIGQTTCIGIGGDPVIGTSFVDCLKLFNKDPDTLSVVMIGEIGGTAEEEAAEYIKSEFKKPVIGFIAGITAPPGRRMGHAGAIITGGKGTASEKMKALERAGVVVVKNPADIGNTMAQVLEKK
ncbi:succinate--CoA ligase subunit alpha [bacterium]|nr:succinate--CoA ligase subunit alpha [bacterium]